LSRCEAISFANLKTFVPSLPFDRDLFLRSHRFIPFPCFPPLLTWWNWLPFQEHCEHILASSSVSQGAAALMRSPRLLPAKAAAVADMFLGLLMTHLRHRFCIAASSIIRGKGSVPVSATTLVLA
jgi:hypothetical protein